MASDGKISNIWDKSPENFSTISSPTLKNVQPYKPEGSNEIFYCSEDMSFLSCLSERTKKRQSALSSEIKSLKGSTRMRSSTPLDRYFSSNVFETPEKVDRTLIKSENSHQSCKIDLSESRHLESASDSQGFYSLPVDINETITNIADEERMLDHISSNGLPSVSEYQKTNPRSHSSSNSTRATNSARRHLFSLAMREKKYYDSKKVELNFIKGYLKDLLKKINEDEEGNDLSDKSSKKSVTFADSFANLSDSTGITNLMNKAEKKFEPNRKSRHGNRNSDLAQKLDHFSFLEKSNNNFSPLYQNAPDLIQFEHQNKNKSQNNLRKSSNRPENKDKRIKHLDNNSPCKNLSLDQITVEKPNENSVEKAKPLCWQINLKDNKNFSENRPQNLQDIFMKRKQNFIKKSNARLENVKNAKNSNHPPTFTIIREHKHTQVRAFELTPKVINLPKRLKPEIYVYSTDRRGRIKEYQEKVLARNRKIAAFKKAKI